MACRVPVIAPNNTSVPEIVGANEERGLMCECGSNDTEWTVIQNDNEVMRPLTNIDSLVEKMKWVYDHRGLPELTAKIEAAYQWVQSMTWESEAVGGAWVEVFKKAHDEVLKEKWVGEQKVGRNDLCPCGSGEKYKHCHGR